MTYAVLTSIVSPTRAVEALATRLRHSYWTLIAVGDEKGPDAFPVSDAVFLDIRRQNLLPYKLARLLPRNHYARKNLGYLHAMAAGAKSIYETDDDNEPLASWAPRSESCEASRAVGSGWVNVYRHFTRQRIWPRGLPLDEIGSAPDLEAEPMGVQAPIQQGLANGSPDVDAVWRLTMDQPVTFDERGSVLLPEGAWCPFNSQSTWWWPDAYPLMYLPSHCSFRMTDIWRGLVAQRCLWAMGRGSCFTAPRSSRNATRTT